MDCVGTFQFNMDAKNRVFLPARFREYFQGGFYVCKGADKCLHVYNTENWAVISSKIQALTAKPGVTAAEVRAYKRDFFRNADMVDLDSQGRFIVKAELAEYAGLKKECLIFGNGDRFEIWNPDEFEAASYHTPTADEIGTGDIF